ncbi:hypothetical protein HPB48_001691 [Haemaphysalis longicornis]|uniref:Uncharacterized protein n=1 Tax=Haemaphysalis longicornis TaxID=44386 RepID=A0A9J6FHV6_HAELO|nr:hypothetical protein HPB48_001691 [Haemaphysalis longicornis]
MSKNYSNEKKRFLTNEEIVANGHVFFVAGYVKFSMLVTRLTFIHFKNCENFQGQTHMEEKKKETKMDTFSCILTAGVPGI